MATKDDESTPRRPMTKCEVLKWFFGARFACDARPDRCAKCPAHVTAPSGQRCNEGSERQEEK